jgi:hypothetical protein
MIGFCQVSVISNATPIALLSDLKASLANNSSIKVISSFESPFGARYLFAMAQNRGGLPKIKIAIIPAPPGWPPGYWAIFHTVQTIEEDHDPVYRVDKMGAGDWKVGPELPEDDTAGWRIASQSYEAKLFPSSSHVEIRVQLLLKRGESKAVPFRLNDNYKSKGAVVATDLEIPTPKEGSIVRAGSLLIPWTRHLPSELNFAYSGTLPTSHEDEINRQDAYLTAWWLPSLGRLPFTVSATIQAPLRWKVRAEGVQESFRKVGKEQIVKFDCNLPISYPKIIGGDYRKVATTLSSGDRYSIYQLEPIDRVRAVSDLKNMVEAASFYRKNLGRLPFGGYECYDSVRYYGIESYSHTLLQRGVTHFISHEMGHSYFGGLAPCPYVDDSWCEGVTEYVDSVLLLHDADQSLENGLKTVDVDVPLTQMPIPWNLGDASYWRGCYVMKMLEAEIGADKVLAALRAIASDRIGKDTRWADLRSYFERSSATNLDWFWNQWIENSTFPTLLYTTVSAPLSSGKWDVSLKVVQQRVPHPFRLRFGVKIAGVADQRVHPVVLSDWDKEVHFITERKPNHIELLVFPYTLARLERSGGSEATRMSRSETR